MHQQYQARRLPGWGRTTLRLKLPSKFSGMSRRDLRRRLGQRVAIIGISFEALCANEPSTPAAYRNADLVAELIRLTGLTFGDALDFGLL